MPEETTKVTWADVKASGKKVKLELVGLDGNAYALMGAFLQKARREKWSPEEIGAVIEECKSGDYDHLLQTLIEVCDG